MPGSWLTESRVDVLLAGLLSIFIAGVWAVSVIRRAHAADIDLAASISLGFSGGITFLILLSLPIFFWAASRGERVDFRAMYLVTLAITCAALWLPWSKPPPFRSGSKPIWISMLVLVCALGVIRITFTRDLVFPPYTDSVEHFVIIEDLLHPERSPDAFYQLTRIWLRYYHFGFHALAGWVASVSGSSIADVMLILGQILQVAIPLGLYFPVRSITRSDAGGLFAVVLAGLAWRMPAFASNWGKYPTLAGIVTLLFALSMLCLSESAESRRGRYVFLAAAGLAGVVSGLTHLRSVVLLVLACLSWGVAGVVVRSGPRGKAIAGLIFGALIAWAAARITLNHESAFMLEPYVRSGFYSTLLVLVLLPLGLKHHPRPAVAAALFLLMIILCTQVSPPPAFVAYGYSTLLDRPFAQIILFLPLSIAGGVGLAGLALHLANVPAEQRGGKLLRSLWPLSAWLLFLAIAVHAAWQNDSSPSPCCMLASNDDVAAFEWIEDNLPEDAVILIAGNRTPTRKFGTDGGIWIRPLTGRVTELWPHNSLLDSRPVLEEICAKGVTHLYWGGTAMRFAAELLQAGPGWYKPVFARPAAAVYEITGCSR